MPDTAQDTDCRELLHEISDLLADCLDALAEHLDRRHDD